MSNLSVNNFPRLSNDFDQQSTELPESVDKSAGETRANTASVLLKNNAAVAKDGTVTFNKDALEKLFEMFEYAFKALRNMLSGQGGVPKLIPGVGPLPKPEKRGDAPVKDTAGTNSNVPNTVAKDKASADSQVPNTAAKDKARTSSQVLNTALKDKTGTNPELSVQKDRPANNPAVPNSELNVTPKAPTLLEARRPDPASGKDVQPKSRSSSDVNVTVQVMNCHCPHPDATKPVPPKPDVPKPVPDVPVSPKPDAPFPPKPDAAVPPKPDAPEPETPTPDKPEPDITAPGPSEDCFEFETRGRRRAFDNDWRFNPRRRISS